MDKPRAPAISPGPWRTLRPSRLRRSSLRGVPEVIPRGALAPGKGVRAKPGTERACGPPRGEHLSGRRPSGPRALADREAAIRQARGDVASVGLGLLRCAERGARGTDLVA